MKNPKVTASPCQYIFSDSNKTVIITAAGGKNQIYRLILFISMIFYFFGSGEP